jgi:hypothetical protein
MRVEGLAGKVVEDGNLAFLGICMAAYIKQDYQIRTNNALCQKEAMVWWLRNARRNQASMSRPITPSTILQRTDNETMRSLTRCPLIKVQLPTLLVVTTPLASRPLRAINVLFSNTS